MPETPVVGHVHTESDGKSVTVALTATVVARQVARAQTWMGITDGAGDSGEYVSLSLQGEYQFLVPHSLAVVFGDTVRIDTTQITGHTPNTGAYNKNAASSTNLDLFKATRNAEATSDANIDVVTGILLVGAYS